MLMIAVISLFVITVDIVSAPVSFTDYPTEDVTVAEGVSVQFTCSATVGGTRRDVTWGIQLTEADNPDIFTSNKICLLYTSPSPRDRQKSRMPSSA